MDALEGLPGGPLRPSHAPDPAGNGGGQQILHSRVNIAVHPAGFAWIESSVAADSPSLAELALAENWQRVIDRRAVPLAFLVHGL